MVSFYLLLVISAMLTVVFIFGINYFTRSQAINTTKKSPVLDLDLEIDDEFLEEIGDRFMGNIYKKSDKTDIYETANVYPECFGGVSTKNCEIDCTLRDECTSTSKIMEEFIV